jgi:hypothetical protein
MLRDCSININPLFSGISAYGVTSVTISGTINPRGAICSDLQVTLSCPASQSSGSATIDNQTGNWTTKLTAKCDCGTNLVTVVASSPSLGCSSRSIGPIVCYVDWYKRSVLGRITGHRRWTMSHHQLTAISSLGSCRKCINLSLTLFGLSLLVLSLGEIMELAIVITAGGIATIVSGLLLSLHAIFSLMKSKKVIIEQPQPRRSCCGSR